MRDFNLTLFFNPIPFHCHTFHIPLLPKAIRVNKNYLNFLH